MGQLEKELGVTVRFRPFELRPEPDPFFAPPPEKIPEIRANLEGQAAKRGLTIHWPAPNSRTQKALEATLFAEEHADPKTVKDYHLAIFKARFVEGKKLDQIDLLVSLGEKVGLNGKALREALEKGRYTQAVIASKEEAIRLGVKGTPTFIVRGKPISGADAWEEIKKALG